MPLGAALKGLASELVLDRLDPGTRGRLLTAGGTAALLLGRKISAAAFLQRGLRDLEAEWRAAHPDFQGGWRERWRLAIDHYEATHTDPTDRKLHLVGVPVVIGGTTGLLLWPSYTPPWFLSAGLFGVGVALNMAGRGLAVDDDPLSYVAGPVADLASLKRWLSKEST